MGERRLKLKAQFADKAIVRRTPRGDRDDVMITQGQVSYIFRGKEMTFDFYPVQPLERLGLSMRGVRKVIGDGYRFTFTMTPSEDIVLKSVSIDIAMDVNQHGRIFANGFQSWTESREYGFREKMPRLKWPATVYGSLVGERAFHRAPSGPGLFHSWTYSFTRSADGNIVLYGSVSERPGYTLFEFHTTTGLLRVKRECEGLTIGEEYTALDIVVLPGREDEVFDAYFREMGGALKVSDRSSPAPAWGWSGSRNHHTDISEPVVLANLAELKKRDIPLDYFIVEDGWQKETGDWLTPCSQFPNGMEKIARAAREAGYKPGLWIAPFVCSRWSQAFRRHRDWLLKDEDQRPVSAGWNGKWGGPYYALDVYNPGFRDYLKQVFATVLDEWGFDLVKVDLLYAAGLRPRERKTRGQVMCDAVEFVRDLVGDKVSLAGGVPLGAAFDNVDYCGINNNVSLRWEDGLRRALGYRERSSTVNAVTSMIGRRHLNGRAFGAAGGAFILGAANPNMTSEQRKTLFMLNLILSDIAFTSDNPAEYSASLLSTFRSAFPLKRKKILSVESRRGAWTVRFEIEGRQYLLLANLASKAAEFRVDPGLYFDPDLRGFFKYEAVSGVRPYASRCLLHVPRDEWTVAGSTGHIFPGCETLPPLVEDGTAQLDLHPQARYEAEVFLRVPGSVTTCVVNGRRLKTESAYDMAFVRIRLSPRPSYAGEQTPKPAVNPRAGVAPASERTATSCRHLLPQM
ncbi:MAG TPA: alpha-galactosidase [Firmicutes bacterium]|nr:alpha-galactosidase [Candidatus Fermentithermobacillaceae bacterium]